MNRGHNPLSPPSKAPRTTFPPGSHSDVMRTRAPPEGPGTRWRLRKGQRLFVSPTPLPHPTPPHPTTLPLSIILLLIT
jgi:hypothetical protein